jgi:hypothetical protein
MYLPNVTCLLAGRRNFVLPNCTLTDSARLPAPVLLSALVRCCRNSQVELVLRPQVQNKAMHDTYLRQGEMKVLEFGDDGEQQQ